MTRKQIRPSVLAYLMIGEAFNMRPDADDEDAYDRISDALDHIWYNRLTEYERCALNYDTRIAMAEALDEPTC
jgi:hypothetical protein